MLTQTKFLTMVIVLLMLLATACGAQPAGTGAEAEPETEAETAADVVAEEEAAESEEAEAQDDASHDEDMEAAHDEEAEEHSEDASAHEEEAEEHSENASAHDEEAEEHSEDEHEHDEEAQAHDEDEHEHDEDDHAGEEGHDHDHSESLEALVADLSPVDLAEGERLQVLASTSIVGDIVSNVAGEAVDLSVLMPIGADLHSFEPVPSDLAAIADADVIFVIGLNAEEALMESLENAGGEALIVPVSTGIELLEFAEGEGHDHGHGDEEEHHDEEGEHHDEEGEHHDEEGEHHDEEGEHHDEEGEHHDEEGEHHDEEEGEHHDEEGEHHDDEAHDHEDEDKHHDDEAAHDHEDEEEHHDDEAAHDHDHGGVDPHVWTTPYHAIPMVHNIEGVLAALDPAQAELYVANAEAYEAQLEELDAWVQEQIETIPAENRELVTDHSVFGYYADRYGLTQVGAVIPSFSTSAEPSAQELAELQDTIAAYDVPAIFVGTTVNPTLSEQIAQDTGKQLLTIYTGSLGPAGSGAETFVDYIRYNTNTFVEGLSQP